MKPRRQIDAKLQHHHNQWLNSITAHCGEWTISLLLATCFAAVVVQSEHSDQSTNSSRPNNHLESISNWLELVSSNTNRRNDTPTARRQSLASGVAVEVTPPNQLFQYQPAAAAAQRKPQHEPSRQILVATANRNARTLANDTPSGGDELAPRRSAQLMASEESEPHELELFVSNVCERDFMLVKVQTSRPFYGVIHTLNHRRRPLCTLEGNGANEYQLNISHVLDSRDPQHCGVIKLSRGQRVEQTSRTGGGELLSVVLAIRTHRNVELSDDKFLVLNCTNRCRMADCSNPVRQRQLEMEDEIGPPNSQDQRSWWARGAKRPGGNLQQQQRRQENQPPAQADCSVWQFSWLVALAACLAILLAGAAISNCIVCRMASLSSSRPPLAEDRSSSKFKGSQRTINYDNRNHHKPVDVAFAQTMVKAPYRTPRKSRADYQTRDQRPQTNNRHDR